MPAPIVPEPRIKVLTHPVWTEHKARLIQRYLFYFVMITKHGTYIDGFAGPQKGNEEDMWSARLVLESRPRWFRNFYLYDINANQVKRLEALKARQPPPDKDKHEPPRVVDIQQGDFNDLVTELLASGRIRDKEATFCLLDQRTFECKWSTVRALSRYKTDGHKIELFYFLPNSWLDRAFSGVTREETRQGVREWWGRDDWQDLQRMGSRVRAQMFADRMKNELGYMSVKSWPIFEREEGGGNVMYFMIHATDHQMAPGLMARAYNAIIPQDPKAETLKFAFMSGDSKDP